MNSGDIYLHNLLWSHLFTLQRIIELRAFYSIPREDLFTLERQRLSLYPSLVEKIGSNISSKIQHFKIPLLWHRPSECTGYIWLSLCCVVQVSETDFVVAIRLLSLVRLFATLWGAVSQGLQHTRSSCHSSSPAVCPSSCPLYGWCYLTMSSPATLFSFWLSYTQNLWGWKSNCYWLKKDAQYESCQLSFIWDKMRPAVWEIIHQIALRICSKEVVGEGQFSHLAMSHTLQPRGLQHARLPCPLPMPMYVILVKGSSY